MQAGGRQAGGRGCSYAWVHPRLGWIWATRAPSILQKLPYTPSWVHVINVSLTIWVNVSVVLVWASEEHPLVLHWLQTTHRWSKCIQRACDGARWHGFQGCDTYCQCRSKLVRVCTRSTPHPLANLPAYLHPASCILHPLTCTPSTFCLITVLPPAQVITTAAEQHSPVKPSAIIAANVDLDALGADDLEYNYDVAGLAGG